MKMSEGIEWAIHCCSLLAHLPESAALPVGALAEFFEVPQTYLAKNLQLLSGAKILTTSKGPGGGYRLARKAEEITLLDIVQAIDGPDPSFRCSEIRQRGPSALAASNYRKPCGIARTMLKAEQAWRDELSKVSILDIRELGSRETNPRQVRKAEEWLAQVLLTPLSRKASKTIFTLQK
jgi:Rrf2 family protein